MTRPVFLVGSVPYDAAEVFERCSHALGGLAKRLPDGEKKGWLPGQDFKRTKGLVPGHGDSLHGPPIVETFRPAPDVDPKTIEFETLHYRPNAVASHAIFRDLREAGKVAPGTRFQVSIPTPFTGSIHFDWDVMRELWPLYEAALFREVRAICAEIPHEDLAISWDVVEFCTALTNPDTREQFSLEELSEAVARCIDVVPAGVEVGLHFCYGGHNSNGRSDDPRHRSLDDTALMTEFGNAVFAAVHRLVNWLHLPVPRPRSEESYFEPLRQLAVPSGTEIYLGLLYLDDGEDGTRRRIAAAEKSIHGFGVATACGMSPFVSKIPPERIPEMLAYHRHVAEHL
jgi:methionine synthase II (cobalamin-independent)